MPLGVKVLLLSVCLNITKFRVIHMHTYSDTHKYSLEQELLPKFHNFDGEYQLAIKLAC